MVQIHIFIISWKGMETSFFAATATTRQWDLSTQLEVSKKAKQNTPKFVVRIVEFFDDAAMC